MKIKLFAFAIGAVLASTVSVYAAEKQPTTEQETSEQKTTEQETRGCCLTDLYLHVTLTK